MNTHINFEKFQVNAESREITFSCCSTTPYERYDFDEVYDEILVINEDSVDLSRLKNSAPLLFNHDTDKLLGVIQDAWIVGDKVFVKARFSANDEFAERIWKDIIDGLIKNVSIGYQIFDYEDKIEQKRNKRYVTRWMIYETSIVSIPADDHCGIRKYEEKQLMENEKVENQTEDIQTETQTEDIQTDAQLEKLQAENEQLKAEVEKLQRLLEDDADDENTSDDDTSDDATSVEPVSDETPSDDENTSDETKELDETEKEEIEKIGEDFNVPKDEIKSAIEQKLSLREFKNKVLTKTFTKKENENMNRKSFKDYLTARNFDTPFMMRDFTGFAPDALVASETLPLSAMLEKKLGVKGFRTISGLHAQVEIPVQTGRVTVTTPGVNEAATDSTPSFEKLVLAPVKFTASVEIGKEMLVASNSDVEAFIIDEITREIAANLEAYMLGKVEEKAGTEINYSDISACTWSDALAFEAAIGGFNVTDASFVMGASTRAALKGIAKSTSAVAAGFICENNEINGYPVNVSGCITDDNIYYGAWDRLVLATFGNDLEILVDPYSASRSGSVVIVGSICADAGLTAPEAFAIGKVQDSSSSSSSSASA